MDPMQILARLGSDNPPTDEELSNALHEFKRLGLSAVNARETDEAADLAKAVEILNSEIAKRAEAAAELEAKLAEQAEAFQDDDEAEDEDEDEAEEAEAEVETVAFDVEAAIRAARNSRARIEAEAVPKNPYPYVKVSALGQAEGEKLDPTATVADVAKIFAQYAKGRNRGRETFVRTNWEMPKDRQLGKEAEDNTRLLASVLDSGITEFEAVAAAGGICGPLDTVYDIPAIGSRGRPVRDALTRFGAGRGGVRYVAAPRLSQGTFTEAVSVWTSENDASPASPAEKPCPHIDCDEICEVTVDAITACLVVGNFQARFNSEQWQSALRVLGLEHDRIAEQNLLAAIDAGSIDATYTNAGGTIAGVLGAIDRAVAGIRSRDRLSNAAGFRVIVDGWLRNALRSQFTVQAPAGQTGAPGASDSAIDAWFAARGVTVTYTQDDSIFGAQSDGALLDFPTETTLRVFPEGTWWFLDGGTLDLGTEIVDSGLIALNDRQAFMETFEAAAKRTAPCDTEGDDSLSITVAVDEACLDACAVTSP